MLKVCYKPELITIHFVGKNIGYISIILFIIFFKTIYLTRAIDLIAIVLNMGRFANINSHTHKS